MLPGSAGMECRMLIPVRDLVTVWGVEPRGVLHVGAHEAEEADAYAAAGWQPVWWVEMLPDKCAALSAKFRDDPLNRVLQGACWDEDGVWRIRRRVAVGDATA